jgi:hypothetical protein
MRKNKMDKSTLFCRIFGHKWRSEWLTKEYINTPAGLASKKEREIYKACYRCGELNPNYEPEKKK